MSKQEQFLWAVQTIMLSNAINMSLDTDKATGMRHVFSATGVMGALHDVVYASERIPEALSAVDAANEFCGYMLANLREDGAKIPVWFARA
ncbi:hypothetical protein ACVCH0_01040 [Burkholderia glumae]|uniref:hypothetical protein n=1 Tax=Burkholderia glumae TaxID=337 RepID=UPI002150DF2A|nr:hypothetical protein [Burkholderia glumae]